MVRVQTVKCPLLPAFPLQNKIKPPVITLQLHKQCTISAFDEVINNIMVVKLMTDFDDSITHATTELSY